LIKLIKNELYKIFHKKTIYIMGIIIIAFSLLGNIMFKIFYDEDGNFNEIISDTEFELTMYEESLKLLDPNKESDKNLYVEEKTWYDVVKLSSEYKNTSWQYYIINNKLYDVIYDINYYTYIEKSDKLLKESKDKYDKYLSYLEKDNYKEFVYLEIKEIEDSIKLLDKEKKETTDKQRLKEIEESINTLEFNKEILNYRINQNISYGSSYLNNALDIYSSSHNYLESIDNIDNLTYEEKVIYNNNLEDYHINKYILDNKVDLNRENTSRSNLINSLSNNEMFIIILIVIITGTIVSSEFNKGTIKSLLIRPYTRTKILLSKYISCIIVLLISIFVLLLVDLLLGGLFFSFDSLSIPVVIYNFNTNLIKEYNVITYTLTNVLCSLPMYIVILTIAFTLSTVTINSQVSISLPLVLYMFSSMINSMAVAFNLKWMKYFITLNWNLNDYLYGRLPQFQYGTLTNSIIMNVVYIMILLVLTVFMFKKKNIKNI